MNKRQLLAAFSISHSMDVNLTDIFEVVLKSAIEAQYRANEYSAKIADDHKQQAKKSFSNSADAKGQNANPYYTIPNSQFKGIGVKFDVNLRDVDTDVQRSQVKIIHHTQRHLDNHLPQLREINSFAKPERLSRELLKCRVPKPESICDLTTKYFALYLFCFWKRIKEDKEPTTSRFKYLSEIESEVIKEVPKYFEEECEIEENQYKEIKLVLNSLASDAQMLKSIKLNIADPPVKDDLNATIEMNLDMRTFSWENYGQK